MRKGEETRQAILDHAVREAARVGLEGLSIGQLARDLGMSKSGLFAHFSSKEALQVEVVDRASQRFTDAVIRPALRAPRGEPRVVDLFERWITWIQRDAGSEGCLFLAAAMELDDQPGPARDRLLEQQRDWLDFIAGAVRIATAEGHFRADLDPMQFAFELNGLVMGFHLSARLLRDPQAETRVRRAFARLVADSRPVTS